MNKLDLSNIYGGMISIYTMQHYSIIVVKGGLAAVSTEKSLTYTKKIFCHVDIVRKLFFFTK